MVMSVYVDGAQHCQHQNLEIEQKEEGYISRFFLHEFREFII